MNILQPETAMDIMSSGNPAFVTTSFGSFNDLGHIAYALMSSLLPLVNLVTVLIIVVSGMLMIGAQDDSQNTTARKVLIAACTALVLINIAIPLRNALLTSFSETGSVTLGVAIITDEVLGIINFVESVAAIIAILFIIVSGIRAIASIGSEQELTNIRRTVIAIVFAMALLVAKFGLVQSFAVTAEPSAFVTTLVNITNRVVGYMALVAVTMIVVAGVYMVANRGEQASVDKAKAIIAKVLIGLIIILASTTVLNFLIMM